MNIQFTPKSYCCYFLNISWIRPLLSISTFSILVQSSPPCTWSSLLQWPPSMPPGPCEANTQIRLEFSWRSLSKVSHIFLWLFTTLRMNSKLLTMATRLPPSQPHLTHSYDPLPQSPSQPALLAALEDALTILSPTGLGTYCAQF